MSGYAYGLPPPPPPPLATSHAIYAQPRGPYPNHGHTRSGGASGGRGAQHGRGRGDYHAASTPPVHYEYVAQQGPPHNSPTYAAQHAPTVAFSPHPHQWTPEHGHVPHPPNAHPHAPAPISASNCHPNYAPNAYPTSQYAQQPPYGPLQNYGYQAPAQPPTPQHWAPHQGHYAGVRGRRGLGDRPGSKPPHGRVLVRHGYKHEPLAPVGDIFGQPFHHEARPPHNVPAHYPYPGPPPPTLAVVHQEGRHGHHHRRGRGGGYRDGSRGRGGHHGSHQHHHGGDRVRQHQRHGQAADVRIKTESLSVGRKKRKTNTLGLTPGMDSESEDDEGEEKTLVGLIGSEALQITDIAAFLAERRKNYPTKVRLEAKKAADLARRDEDKASSLERQADRLRRQLRRVESSIKRKREQGDEGDEMRYSTEGESDEKPEVMSSRPDAAEPAPPAAKADVTRHCKYYSTGGTCGKKGKCRFVHDPEAREAAMKEREANHGRMTIQQRLTLNDKEQEDLTVLQSIQYLRAKGLMEPGPKAVEGRDRNRSMDVDMEDATPKSMVTPSLLPAPPASLPDPPIKREAGLTRRNPPPSVIPTANSVSSQGLEHYQSWLLQPYGSTNGRQSMSDDLP